MDTSRSRRRRTLGRLTAGASVALALFLGLQQIDVSGQAARAKLSGVLADLARSVPQEPPAAAGRAIPEALAPGSLPKSVQDAMHGQRLRINDLSEVQVYILGDELSGQNRQALAASGVTIEIADAPRRRVQARIPASRLQAVAELPFVDYIRLPNYAVRRAGSAMSEGDAILHADAVRQQLSLDGTGVKVGVVSDGLKGLFATGCTVCGGASGGPIATGDLPASTGTRTASGVLTASTGGVTGRSFQANSDLEGLPPARQVCAFPGAGAEGTALLEVIHDLAPAAQLSFANADTDLAFNQAVNYLAANNDVVMDDLGFYGEAYDGTSPVSSNTAAALNNPSNRIRAYVTAAGNAADEHYFGMYADSGVDGTVVTGITTPGDLHLFQLTADTTDVLGRGPQPYNLIQLPLGGEVLIFLTWDDPFGASANDYDLFLVQESTNRAVASSTDAQTGRQDPFEAIDYVNSAGTGLFRIVVQNVRNQAQPKALNLYSFQPQCAADGPRLLLAGHHERHNYNTAGFSVAAQSDSGGSPVSVISVGAICSASDTAAGVFSGSIAPDESCLDSTHSTIEFFSSRGPTLDGRLKPDVSAIDGVTITGSGGFGSPFFGTSAATPHVAGIAALLLQAAPCLMAGSSSSVGPDTARATLRNLIVGHAVPLGDGVPNTTFGYGRADALASAQKTLPVFGGPATVTVSGNTAARREHHRCPARVHGPQPVFPHEAVLDRRVRHFAGFDHDLPVRHDKGQRVGEQQRTGVLPRLQCPDHGDGLRRRRVAALRDGGRRAVRDVPGRGRGARWPICECGDAGLHEPAAAGELHVQSPGCHSRRDIGPIDAHPDDLGAGAGAACPMAVESARRPRHPGRVDVAATVRDLAGGRAHAGRSRGGRSAASPAPGRLWRGRRHGFDRGPGGLRPGREQQFDATRFVKALGRAGAGESDVPRAARRNHQQPSDSDGDEHRERGADDFGRFHLGQLRPDQHVRRLGRRRRQLRHQRHVCADRDRPASRNADHHRQRREQSADCRPVRHGPAIRHADGDLPDKCDRSRRHACSSGGVTLEVK